MYVLIKVEGSFFLGLVYTSSIQYNVLYFSLKLDNNFLEEGNMTRFEYKIICYFFRLSEDTDFAGCAALGGRQASSLNKSKGRTCLCVVRCL